MIKRIYLLLVLVAVLFVGLAELDEIRKALIARNKLERERIRKGL